MNNFLRNTYVTNAHTALFKNRRSVINLTQSYTNAMVSLKAESESGSFEQNTKRETLTVSDSVLSKSPTRLINVLISGCFFYTCHKLLEHCEDPKADKNVWAGC